MRIEKSKKFYKFKYAAQNQKVFDQFYYNQIELSAKEFNYFPRPAKWAKKNSLKNDCIKILSLLGSYLWGYVLCYFYIVAMNFRYAAMTKNNYTPPENAEQRQLALAICEHSCDTILKICKTPEFLIWLAPPNAKISERKIQKLGIKIVNAASVLTLKDIINSCIDSLRSHYYIVSKYGIEIGFQSYALPSWMIMYSATQKIDPEKIFTAEHHDRWAILADCYCSEKSTKTKKCTLTLVQHGLEHPDTYRVINSLTDGQGLPYKLKNVSSLHVYDSNQLELFKKNILESDHKNKNPISAKFLTHKIKLENIRSKKLSILFIGHPICEEFHINLQKVLSKKIDADIFYKPHPAANASQKIKKAQWQIISDTEFFPRVDLVVGYPSTLVVEYEENGIPNVIHDIKASDKYLDRHESEIYSAILKMYSIHEK